MCDYGWSGSACDDTEACQSVTVTVAMATWAKENFYVVSKLDSSSAGWQAAHQSHVGDFDDNTE